MPEAHGSLKLNQSTEFRSTEPSLTESRDIPVWSGSGVRISAPKKPLVHPSEGLNFVVGADDENDQSWVSADPKDTLKQAYYSLPLARIMSEANSTPDYWANIQLKSVLGHTKGVNVIGRNPRSKSGWAKPPGNESARSVGVNSVDPKIAKMLERYIPMWEKEDVVLFPGGVKDVVEDSEEFKTESKDRNMDILWMNDKYTIDVVKRPHLTGIHLVVSQREEAKAKGKITRPWQVSEDVTKAPMQRQDFLEEFAIILAAQKVMWQSGVPYFHPEIQFNGNWTPTMQSEEKGGNLDTEKMDTNDEKRSHRQHQGKDWLASTHGHLYATGSPDEFVHLPSRPEAEVPDEWSGINPASEAEVDNIRDILQSKLTPYLEQNMVGKL